MMLRNTHCLILTFTLLVGVFVMNANAAQKNTLKIKISGNGYTDETIIRYIPNATESFDASYDAWKLFSANPNVPHIYTRSSVGELSINSKPDLIKDLFTIVHVELPDTGWYTLDFDELFPFKASTHIIFEDSVEQVFLNLSNVNTYNFYVNDLSSVYGMLGRFKIHSFLPPALSILQPECDGDDSKVTINKPGLINWNFKVEDVSNNNVFNHSSSGEVDSLTSLSPSDYTITIDYFGVAKHLKQFTIKPGVMVKADFDVQMDQPDLSPMDEIEFIDLSENSLVLSWDFGDGNHSEELRPKHFYSTPGDYEVMLKAKNGNCVNAYSKIIQVQDAPTGIHDLTKTLSRVFYDNSSLQLNFASQQAVKQVTIYSLDGKELRNEQINTTVDALSIPFNHYDSGIHLCVVELHNQQLITTKVFLQ